MTARTSPPFRADQVGSLLRPERLKAARLAHDRGETSDEALRAVEDDCIRDVVKFQEDVGLKAVTDGEFRRVSWQRDFLRAMDGVDFVENAGTNIQGLVQGFGFAVNGKVRNPGGLMAEDFSFLKPLVRNTAKVCIPSPSLAYHRGGRAMIDSSIYSDLDQFWDDIVAAWKAEISSLAALGCTYVQIDDTSFAMLCDSRTRASLSARGDDPDALLSTYAHAVTRAVADRPEGMRATVHMCRGNFESNWNGEGGYEPVAEKMFTELDVDGFFMEWDSDRAGGFEPLRFVRPGQVVVLGLVTSKTPVLESKDLLKRRIDEAAKYVPLDNLCLSPQCGFASTLAGNKLSFEDERKKLDLVVETADEVWGGA